MNDNEESFAKLPRFNGKHEIHLVCASDSVDMITAKSFFSALTVTAESDLRSSENEDLSQYTDAEQNFKKAAFKQNADAIAALSRAINDEQQFQLIVQSIKPDLPRGLTWEVIAALKEPITPNNKMTMVEFTRAISSLTMGEHEMPTALL